MSRTLEEKDLPAAAKDFVDAWQAGDADKVASLFAEDATASDQGETFKGLPAIRKWIDESIHLFKTTVTFLGAREVDGMVGTSYRLKGDFPGGVVDLEYQFHLNEDGRIVQWNSAPSAV